jgi:hypothetical protein
MRVLAATLIALALTAAPATAQSSSGLWSYQFQNGIGQYSTGEWGSAAGGALGLACKANGNVSILTEIAGRPTPGGRRFSLTTSSRAGSRTHSFTAGRDGSLTLRADSPAFRALWADIRARDIVTLRHGGGEAKVLSLAGAKRLLPPKPCG